VTFAGVRDDVAQVLRASDVMVLSSRVGTETFPNVLLEAMATGLPVITTDVGSVREMVEDGRSAIVVAPEDETALRGAIERLAGNADLRHTFGVRARAVVEARFRIELMCAEREALFEELLRSA
jgi:glycosyltransferase involved in cell wall biosynthesis